VALIAANVAVYLYQFSLSVPGSPSRAAAAARASQAFVFEFGLIPCRLGEVCPPDVLTAVAGAPPAWLTIFTSMFVHGGLFHIGGNMLYLWIFGNNVEDSMGRGRFVVFYLLCGAVAAFAQYLGGPASAVPMVGASGAVSGTLGAYLVLHPRANVLVLFIFGFFWRVQPIPAVFVLGLWIVVQLVNGVVTFGGHEGGGIAFLAHVGGFVAGMVLIHLFRQRPRIAYWRS